jgi:glutamate-ammonia-ligase adenylyltransferase
MLRARVVAGDAELGQMLHRQVISPFVYRRNVGPSVATALAELVQRSRLELCRSPERDLKLGPGGIREAEFFVQALQLIWGGREPSLRVTGTLAALARLQSRGLVTDREARLVSDAYLLLRRVEHRIQWMSGIQTHSLPEPVDDRARIARSLGLGDERALGLQLDQARGKVAELFASLAPEAPRPPPRYHLLLTHLDAADNAAQKIDGIDRRLQTPEVQEHLAALTRRPDCLFGELTRERYPEVVDRVLQAVSGSPDPEQAIRYLRAFFGRFVSAEPYSAALAEDERAVHRFVSVLGASTMVGDAIISHPDLADIVLFERGQVNDPAAVVQREIDGSDGAGDDPQDAVVAALRRAKRRMTVEVAVADLAGSIDLRSATRLLSDLADEILQRTVALVQGDQPRGLAVMAMGKLGGRDIGYGSDLDVIFIYDPEAAPEESDASVYFIRLAQRIVRLLSTAHPGGAGYELDTRLRPSGSQGMLVTSLRAFARYHNVALDSSEVADPSPPSVVSSGEAWERQALLRARPCAGDPALGEQVLGVIHRAAYEGGAPDVRDMHRLRLRMQNELGREREGRFDLKTGRGGLLDIEFSAQWLQMRFGFDRRIRTTDTLQALEALFAAGYLHAGHYETLHDGYLFLRRLEQRIHVLHGAGTSVIDEQWAGLSQLARRMGLHAQGGLSPPAHLMDRYREATRAVRTAYLEVLGLDDDEPGSETLVSSTTAVPHPEPRR